MKYIYNTTDFTSEVPSAITLGKFDGLHRGHQKLIREILRLQEQKYYGIVFTIAPENTPSLLTLQEKCGILEQQGINCMIRCPFVPEILSMEPETFVAEVLVGALKAAYLVVGTDFRFGYRRSGDVSLLKALQEKYGYQLIVLEKECCGSREISSTYIKETLAQGQMEQVGSLLGYAYTIQGKIIHGQELGRRIGVPTINMAPPQDKLLPPAGVYCSRVEIGQEAYCGITNIGCKPTVDGKVLGAETYLYGVQKDLYDQEAKVHLLKFCRPEQKFSGIDALKAQLEQDVLYGKEYFGVR